MPLNLTKTNLASILWDNFDRGIYRTIAMGTAINLTIYSQKKCKKMITKKEKLKIILGTSLGVALLLSATYKINIEKPSWIYYAKGLFASGFAGLITAGITIKKMESNEKLTNEEKIKITLGTLLLSGSMGAFGFAPFRTTGLMYYFISQISIQCYNVFFEKTVTSNNVLLNTFDNYESENESYESESESYESESDDSAIWEDISSEEDTDDVNALELNDGEQIVVSDNNEINDIILDANASDNQNFRNSNPTPPRPNLI